jgi:hypothetical protein
MILSAIMTGETFKKTEIFFILLTLSGVTVVTLGILEDTSK